MTMAPPAGCGFPASGQSQPGGHNPNALASRTTGTGQPAPSGRAAAGAVTAYAAAIAAFSYALVSAYWALGGHGLVSTVGGYAGQVARREGAAPELLALTAMVAKAACGLLALALVRPWGRVIPRRWLRAVSATASALLIVYGGLNVLAAALVLSGVLHPGGRVDRTALRWHAGVWDLWIPPGSGPGQA